MASLCEQGYDEVHEALEVPGRLTGTDRAQAKLAVFQCLYGMHPCGWLKAQARARRRKG